MDWQVIKNGHTGKELFRYPADLVHQTEALITVRAFFGLDDRDAGYVIYKKGDLFVETFYRDRWYNVFAIYDRDHGQLKGWYCNITRPASWNNDDKLIAADDLAMDVWVTPDGKTTVMDEDEYAVLNLTSEEDKQVKGAVIDIMGLAASDSLPR